VTDKKKKKSPTGQPHKWRFFRSGGFDQVRLDSGADLLALEQLDPKLWAALSCPTHRLYLDDKTLEFMDTDGDGRIRVPEILAAVQWSGSVLKNPDDLTAKATSLPLTAIDDSTAEGARLLASAKRILLNLGKQDSPDITTSDTADTEKIFAETRFNGDGIIPPDSADDDETRTAIENVMTCLGSVQDRNGAPGISQDMLGTFFNEARDYAEWWTTAESDPGNLLPFGDGTGEAMAAFAAVKGKIDDYFTRCRLAEFDPQASEPLNPAAEQYEALAPEELSAATDAIAAFPLARIVPNKALPLTDGVNPAWTDMLDRFRAQVVTPSFGATDNINAGQWASLSAGSTAYGIWMRNKKGAVVECLGLERVRQLLQGGVEATITALIAKDEALKSEVDAIASVDKLIRYHRDLFTLLNNFVSFRDFYTPEIKAIFQAGTLYLDGRSCQLCLQVDDVDKHASLATLSRTYLAYCQCVRHGEAEEKMKIVAAFTDGDADNLMIGRNGLFYDRNGRDWHATIIKIIEHPISVQEAFWSPYKRIGRIVGEQVEKWAAAREKEVQAKAVEGIAVGAEKDKPAAPPFDVAKFAGIFAAIGLAIGAIGTAIAALVTGFLTLSWWQMPIAPIGVVMAISGPSMTIAFLKLRKRNLAPILDANGWAINTRARINMAFGASLTGVVELPAGWERALKDPYARRKRVWKRYVVILVLLITATALWVSDVLPPMIGTVLD
jgi:hypothetical protein